MKRQPIQKRKNEVVKVKKISKISAVLLAVALLMLCMTGCGAKKEIGNPEDHAPAVGEQSSAGNSQGHDADESTVPTADVSDKDEQDTASATAAKQADGSYVYTLCHGDVSLSLKTDIWKYIHNGVWEQAEMLEDFGFTLADHTDSANRWTRDNGSYSLQTRIMGTGDGYAGYIDFIRYTVRGDTKGKERDEVYRIDITDGHETYRSTFGSKELKVPIELIILFAKCAEDDFSDVAMLKSFEKSPYVEYTANGYVIHE